MKITDKEKTDFLLKLSKEHYSQGDDYHAWKSKKDKWHFGHSNDHELQHGQGNSTIIDDSMLEILMNREVVNDLPIGSVMPRSLTAENGAKALLIGEFNETYEDTDEEGNEYSIKIPVRWTTIKDIYKKIIDRYGA